MAELGRTTFKRLRLKGGSGSYILLPVLTTTQRDALSPAAGWQIWNSTTAQAEEYNGSSWVAVGQVILTTHTAVLNAHMDSLQRLQLIGQYQRGMPIEEYAACALVALTMYWVPFLIPRNATYDLIAIHVSTQGASGKIARLGIYADNGSVYPGALTLDAGTVAVSSTGIKAISISKALTKGLYWVCIVSDGIPTLRAYLAATSPLGNEATTFTTSTLNDMYLLAAVGTGALASTASAGASIGYGGAPSILLRVLSMD